MMAAASRRAFAARHRRATEIAREQASRWRVWTGSTCVIVNAYTPEGAALEVDGDVTRVEPCLSSEQWRAIYAELE